MKHLSQSCTASYHQPTTGNKKAKSEVMAKIDEAAKKDTANHVPTIKPSESTPEELGKCDYLLSVCKETLNSFIVRNRCHNGSTATEIHCSVRTYI